MTIDTLFIATDATQRTPLSFIQIALFIFIAIFIGLLIWVIFAKRGTFNKVARIPLEDDQVVVPRHGSAQQDHSQRPQKENKDQSS